MATMNLVWSLWSYNGVGTERPTVTFKNPSSSERAEVSTIKLWLGSVNGECTAGDYAYGNGASFNTWLRLNGKQSNILSITNKVGVKSYSGGTYPNRYDTKEYTFTFSPAVSIPAGGSAILYIKTPTQSKPNGQVLCLAGDPADKGGHYIVVTYQNIPNKQPKPSSANISLQNSTSYDSKSISWKVSTSGATNYKLYIDGADKGNYSTSTTSATSSVSSTKHTLQIAAWNGNSDWTWSNTITVDCTIPPINNASITPTASNRGTLKFSSTYKVNYFLNNTRIGTVNANTMASANVTLQNNVISSYTLMIKRSDNEKITNSKVISNVDTSLANLTLNLTDIIGLRAMYTVNASKPCRDWKYTLENVDKGQVFKSNVYAGTLSNLSGTIVNLIAGDKYTLVVTAVNSSNGLTSTSNKIEFTVPGVARIYVPGRGWREATVYVYSTTERKWKVVSPYIYQNDTWKLCM